MSEFRHMPNSRLGGCAYRAARASERYQEFATRHSAPDLYRNLSICRLLIRLSSVVLGIPSMPAAPFRPATRPMLFCRAASINSFSRLMSDEERPGEPDDGTAPSESSHSSS